VSDDPKALMLRAAEAKEKGLGPSQQKRRDIIDRRNKAIQEHGVRPKDGITFARKGSEK
jgi:hypothetical protein